jgi:hypothetical protein
MMWTGETVLGARVYQPQAYGFAFLSLVACCLAGALCMLGVRETYCRTQA